MKENNLLFSVEHMFSTKKEFMASMWELRIASNILGFFVDKECL